MVRSTALVGSVQFSGSPINQRTNCTFSRFFASGPSRGKVGALGQETLPDITVAGAGREKRQTCSLRGREFRACVSSLASPERQSLALGVAQSLTVVRRLGAPVPCSPAPVASLLVGVGHSAALISSLQAPEPRSDSSPERMRSNCASLAVIPEVVTRGVGHCRVIPVRLSVAPG